MNRNTVGYAQMGGEGVPLAVAQRWNGGRHMFQNLGEGTWYHSGSLAIRQAVAAKANITYKILYNDAVAMTGGQAVDGPVSVLGIAQSCRAEGVERIALVSDHPEAYAISDFPKGTTLDHRRRLDEVQRELRAIKGVTVLIYEQTCATEKRRRRKRGEAEDPARFVMINEAVCEGCGDCSLESNCLSVEPVETPLGRKRRINQSSCNKDFSCLNGFCPSFVTIEGGQRRKPAPVGLNMDALRRDLPQPVFDDLDRPYDILVAGVGGTGVVTVGALITMAAHLEGKGASVLDFTGFAQKFGTVLGYIRLAHAPDDINQVRIERGHADAVIGCDAVVCSAPKASGHYRDGTRVVLNLASMPTGDLVLNRDADLRLSERKARIEGCVGKDNVIAFDANHVSEQLMGDAVFANIMMLGAAWQKALVPVSEEALKQAIRLNGVAVEKNSMAFDLGRCLAHDAGILSPYLSNAPEPNPKTAQEIIGHRAALLTEYQNAAYARTYTDRLADLNANLPGDAPDTVMRAAAISLYRLMAYKDEYEVARLHVDEAFESRIAQQFEGDFKIRYHLAPPLLPTGMDSRGRKRKKSFGPWMRPAFRLLAKMRGLRGTWADPFGFSADRKLDRKLLRWFDAVMRDVACNYEQLGPERAEELLSGPQDIRGYGPVRHSAADNVMRKTQRLLGAGAG